MTATYNITDLGTLGGNFSRAESINDQDMVVGQSSIPLQPNNLGQDQYAHPFFWKNGQMKDLMSFPPAAGQVYPGWEGIARSINSRGDIVGSINLFPGDLYGIDTRARLWRDGKRIRLASDDDPLLGMPSSEAYKINDKGVISGNAIDAAEGPTLHLYKTRSFLFDQGTIRAVPYLNDTFGINNWGDQCGCVTRDGTTRVVLRRGSRVQNIGSASQLHYNLLREIVINDKDEVAGTASDYTGANSYDADQLSPQAFFWRKGRWFTLESLPGYPDSIVRGINNSGQIVGEVRAASGRTQEHPPRRVQDFPPQSRAVLWNKGKAYDLGSLIPENSGWTLQGATAINNRGHIVGYGTIGGETHGFLLRLNKANGGHQDTQ